MSARTKARKRAIDLFYSSDVRGQSVEDALAAERIRAASEPARRASFQYAEKIAEGYIAHRSTIDEMISTYARGWTIERMPKVDLAILRTATWELLYNDEVPAAVAISEAKAQAAELSTEDSARFIQGVLSGIVAGS